MDSLVTVCITTYNRKKLLPLTLASILNQTYRNIEIIIVDDCSTDGTKKLVEEKLINLDSRIKYIRHKKNKGLASGRNTALFNAKGRYFTFCDDDDELLTTYIEEFVNIASNYSRNWCFCCANIGMKKSNKMKLKNAILKGHTPPVASQFYFTDTLKQYSGYNEKVKSGVDHDLWLTLSFHNINIYFLNRRLSIPDSFSSDHIKMTTDFNKRIKGVESSLLIWKKKIILNYGNNFFTHFRKEYRVYLTRKILIHCLRSKSIGPMYIHRKLIFRNLFSSFYSIVKAIVNKKIMGTNIPLFKAFKDA